MITGGLGMIGSALAHPLVKWGADVTLVDACIEPYGANLFNIEGIQEKLTLNISDIRDKESMKWLVRGKDIVFNLAAQVSHNDSMRDPYLDADINYLGHLNVLECLKKFNPKAVVLHSGSRLQFGKIDRIPVDEKHPLNPRTPYALNKTAAEDMYLFYRQMYGIPCVLFRIANPYGPRSQMKHHQYSMINWFIRQAMEGKTIRVFGDGDQIRDYIYVDDLAQAFLTAAVSDACYGETFNIGSGVGTKFREMAEGIVSVAGRGTLEYVPWPENYVNVETGDYVTNINKFSGLTGWNPKTSLREGLAATYAFYKKFRSHYWSETAGAPALTTAGSPPHST